MRTLGTARAAVHLIAGALLLLGGCTKRLYEGPPLPADQVAVIHVGDTVVREIDGRRRRGGAFDVGHFEVAPGKHRLGLVFEMPARSLGIRSVPAQRGEGMCRIEFVARAGRQYWLGARAIGEEWIVGRWDGRWEAWLRDPSVSSDDDIIARCSSQPEGEPAGPPETATPAPVVGEPAAAPPAGPSPAPIPETAAGAPRPGVIRLGTWNLRRLGQDAAKDMARVAAAIDQSFDVVTITEVMRAGGTLPGYDRLMQALGDDWGGLTAPAPSGDQAESYAIVYRRDRVRPCPGWAALRVADDAPGASRGAGPFARPPAFACFETDGSGSAAGVDFLLGAYRATWADGDAEAVAAEVSHLDGVFAAMRQAHPSEADLLIAGDFNLDSDELPPAITSLDRTRGDGSLLALTGRRRREQYDHILVHDHRATAEIEGDAAALDLRGLAASPADFVRTMSDHLPIMVRLRSAGPDDD